MKRSVVGMVVLWALVVATMSAVVWVVIDRAGQAVVAGPSVAVPLTAQRPPTSTPAASTRATPTTTATPTTPTTTATPSTTAPTSPPGEKPTPTTTATIQPSGTPIRTRSFGTQGGTATVSCGSFGIRLDAASPADGFRSDVSGGDGDGSLEVVFVTVGPPEVEHELSVTCQGGIPLRTDG